MKNKTKQKRSKKLKNITEKVIGIEDRQTNPTFVQLESLNRKKTQNNEIKLMLYAGGFNSRGTFWK